MASRAYFMGFTDRWADSNLGTPIWPLLDSNYGEPDEPQV